MFPEPIHPKSSPKLKLILSLTHKVPTFSLLFHPEVFNLQSYSHLNSRCSCDLAC